MPAASFQPQTIDLSASFVQLIRTALANPKVTFDKTGLKSYDAAGTLVSAINSDGTAQLKGVLSALGLIAPASTSNATPQPSNSFQWQRQSDGSQVAQLWAGSTGGTEAMLGETNSLAQTDTSTIILRVKDDQATVHSSIQISQHNRGSGQILVGPVPAAGGGTTNLVLCTEGGLSDFIIDTSKNGSADWAVTKEAPLNPCWAEYGVRFDGVTDDTAAWNRVIAALPTKGGEVYVPPLGTSIITQLTLPINSIDLVMKGGGSEHGGGASCTLQSNYAGAGAIIQANASRGLRWEGINIVAINPAFSGKVLDLSRGAGTGDTTMFAVRNCRLSAPIQATPQGGSGVNLLQLTKATVGEVVGVYLLGGARGVEGLVAQGDYTNAVTIGDGCYFASQDIIAIHNLGLGCRVERATFEPLRDGSAGAYLQDANIPLAGHLAWLHNYTGDGNGNGSWITFNGYSLTVIGWLDNAANAILLNGETRELSVGGYLINTSAGNGINFNGQIVRTFRDLGLHGGPRLYTGTSRAVGGLGGMASGSPAVEVALTAPVSMAASAFTAIPFNTENFDTLYTGDANGTPQWNPANPTRLTAPAPGRYHVYATLAWALSNAGDRSLTLRLNGTTYRNGSRISANPLARTVQTVSAIVQMNAGDYVEIMAMQTTGGNLNIDVNDSGAGAPTVFGMAKIN